MKQLRHLEEIELYTVTKAKQPNGTYLETPSLVGKYEVQFQELTDELSASLYGANIDRMSRISSVFNSLESYLLSRIAPVSDNISDYFIVYDSLKYRIVVVRQHWVDIELLGTYGTN